MDQKLPSIRFIVSELHAALGDDFFTFSDKWKQDENAIGLMHDGMTVHIAALGEGEAMASGGNFLLDISMPLENTAPLVHVELDAEQSVVDEVLNFFS